MNPLDPQSPEAYRSVARYGQDEYTIEKSRFIGYAKPVDTEDDARAFIAEIKNLHPQATHVCSAYIIGRGGLTMRFSDDGEPSGTAGIPMLEVLKKENLTDTVVAVVRYFGGIKLGAGGLVRAYTHGTTIALDAAKIVTYTRHYTLNLTIDYTHQGTVTFELDKTNWIQAETTYDTHVHHRLYIPQDQKDQATQAIQNWTNGKAQLDWGEMVYKG